MIARKSKIHSVVPGPWTIIALIAVGLMVATIYAIVK